MENTSRIPGPLSDIQLTELQEAHRSGVLPANRSSVALAASLIIKPSGGKLYGLSVYSNKGTSQFIQLFDANALPADGQIPVAVFTVLTIANLGIYFGSVGRSFEQGIVVCNSSTAATKTIGAADCWFDAQFI